MKKLSKKLLSLILALVMVLVLIPANITTTTIEAASFSTSKTLKKGSKGTQVKYLQYGLAGLGYLKDSADGDFGSKTQAAVKSYQKANGLTVDGLAGKKTLSSIKAKVSDIQEKLKKHGYYTGSVDGIYGSGTKSAVKKFQKAKGLTADGIVGSKTLAKLNNSSSASGTTSEPSTTKKPEPVTTEPSTTKKPEPATTEPSTTKKPEPATTEPSTTKKPEPVTTEPSTTKKTETTTTKPSTSTTSTTSVGFKTTTTLKKGSKGTQVKYLQYGLVGLGYLKGSVDGNFGTATQTAVKSYQKANGLTADGLAGKATLTSIKKKVSDIQTKLKKQGYYTGSADGIYASGTKSAVKKYQKAKGLSADGIAGSKTLAKLNGTTSSSSSSSSSSTTSSSSSSNTTTSSNYSKTTIKSLYQTGDYSRIYYNGGKKSTTVASSGCGGVSLAMALNALLGTTKYTGKNVMQWFANNGYYKGSGTIQSGLVQYPKKLGLKATYCDTQSELESHLKKGRLAIAIVKNKTGEAYFSSKTTSGHYILLSGYRVNNGVKQIFVNNPMRTKSSTWFSLSKLHANVKNEREGYSNSYVIVYK